MNIKLDTSRVEKVITIRGRSKAASNSVVNGAKHNQPTTLFMELKTKIIRIWYLVLYALYSVLVGLYNSWG